MIPSTTIILYQFQFEHLHFRTIKTNYKITNRLIRAHDFRRNTFRVIGAGRHGKTTLCRRIAIKWSRANTPSDSNFIIDRYKCCCNTPQSEMLSWTIKIQLI